MSPLTSTHITPTGQRLVIDDTPEQRRANDIAAAHADLERCQQLREEALATPIGAEWTARDRWDYMRHLDETEAALKGGKP